MNSKKALLVLAHGAGLVVLALLTNLMAPETARVTLVSGLIGGGLCVLWGILGLLGFRRLRWAVLTLIAVSFVLIKQAVSALVVQGFGESKATVALLLITVMLIGSLVVLGYLLHADGGVSTNGAGVDRSKNIEKH